MKHKQKVTSHIVKHVWLIIGTWAVFFAVFSAIEEVASGNLFKTVAALIFGTLTYLAIKHHIFIK
jgi:hypothetical protein